MKPTEAQDLIAMETQAGDNVSIDLVQNSPPTAPLSADRKRLRALLAYYEVVTLIPIIIVWSMSVDDVGDDRKTFFGGVLVGLGALLGFPSSCLQNVMKHGSAHDQPWIVRTAACTVFLILSHCAFFLAVWLQTEHADSQPLILIVATTFVFAIFWLWILWLALNRLLQ
ncbi:hypothetical protein DIPPA_70001 [Diplonema papillatum]|nr:hypothetical protein DIPPA_63719 [Diplonema papillatum]KAJ9471551.1 hypothetical protein DIPPA_70001 [Diplonema papillatum]